MRAATAARVLFAATMVQCALSFHAQAPITRLRSGNALGDMISGKILPAVPSMMPSRRRKATQGAANLEAAMIPALAPAIQVTIHESFPPCSWALCRPATPNHFPLASELHATTSQHLADASAQTMTSAASSLSGVLVLGGVIAFHEAGHFLAARTQVGFPRGLVDALISVLSEFTEYFAHRLCLHRESRWATFQSDSDPR